MIPPCVIEFKTPTCIEEEEQVPKKRKRQPRKSVKEHKDQKQKRRTRRNTTKHVNSSTLAQPTQQAQRKLLQHCVMGLDLQQTNYSRVME